MRQKTSRQHGSLSRASHRDNQNIQCTAIHQEAHGSGCHCKVRWIGTLPNKGPDFSYQVWQKQKIIEIGNQKSNSPCELIDLSPSSPIVRGPSAPMNLVPILCFDPVQTFWTVLRVNHCSLAWISWISACPGSAFTAQSDT